jgi:large subunit ribosomal protein L23
MDYTQILLKPLVSEKTTLSKEFANQVVFYVHPKANKIEIKKAVEQAFDVKVDGVNVVRKRPSVRTRFGRPVGKQSGHKKAYVTLAPGEKIEFFEGV